MYLKIVENYEQSLSAQIKKEQGIVYTPKFIVNYLLDKTIAKENPRILDPACGTGNFLIEATNRLHRRGKSIKSIIEENIFGIDCDYQAISTLKSMFAKHCPSHYNLYTANALDKNFLQNIGKFDVVVGNPPYVKIQNIRPYERAFLKDWTFTKGDTDLYVAFIELAFSLIKDDGIIGFIVPSGFIKNKMSALLEWLLENRYIEELLDFESNQVFPGVTTYTCLLVGNKRSKSHFVLKKASHLADTDLDDLEPILKDYDKVNNRTLLIAPDNEDFVYRMENSGPKLKDLVDIRVGLQTSADRLFFLRGELEDGFLTYKGYRIEREILLPCCKVSRRQYGYIIFPYHIEDNKAIPMSEGEIKEKHKGAYIYLLRHKVELIKRERGKIAGKWWLYGRAQSLTTLFGKKLFMPSMIKEPKFDLCENEHMVYFSGYAMFGENLKKIKEALESEDFKRYIHITSKDFKSGWKACSKYLIENFSISSLSVI